MVELAMLITATVEAIHWSLERVRFIHDVLRKLWTLTGALLGFVMHNVNTCILQ